LTSKTDLQKIIIFLWVNSEKLKQQINQILMRKISLLIFMVSILFACNRNSSNQTNESISINHENNSKIKVHTTMKVLLLNGSPHKDGCTFTALSEIAKALNEDGIEAEIIQVGDKAIRGCIACAKCRETGVCVFDDLVNEVIEKAKTADGFIFGSPVYYSGINGTMKSFLDRLFYSGSLYLAYKPGAGVVSARRAGTVAALQQLNMYFTINNMPVVSSQYWNMVHGNTAEEVLQDKEGLQIMRVLGHNMAWLLKSIEAGEKNGIEKPKSEPRERTNFIR
jgi:multimeric flavodoxin WrbA